MEKNLDSKGRWRNKLVGFRVSEEEAKLIDDCVALSGLTKQDYIIRRLQCRDVVVQGNPRVYKALRNQMADIYEELKRYVRDDKEKLKVFDKNGVYLPMKKVGKNNPKAVQIEADNRVRTMWNQTVDRAFVSGVPEKQILDVKQSEIGQKTKASIQQSGRNPALFKSLIMTAIYALELLISKVFKTALEKADKVTEAFVKSEPEQAKVRAGTEPVMAKSEPIPEMPKKSELASKYPRLADIYNKLEKQNEAIYHREQKLASVEKEIAGTKGIFKGKQRKELQEQAEQLQSQIASMKQYLSSISCLNIELPKQNIAIISRQLQGGNSRPEIRQSRTALGQGYSRSKWK